MYEALGIDPAKELHTPEGRPVSILAEGATVVAYDPVATDAARASLGRPDIRFATTMEQAVEGADAVVLLTAWAEFLRVPYLLL